MLRVFFLLMVLVVSCDKEQAIENIENQKQAQDILSKERAENVEIIYTDSGILKSIITAPVLIGDKSTDNPTVEMPQGLTAEFFDSDRVAESFIKAEYGIHYQNEKKVVLKKNVEVKNIQGETLNTEELIWDQEKEIIYTDKFVKITREKEILMGMGMTANQNFTEWEIKKGSGEIKLD
jgi:LPS export ABC transporter protein LptC